MPGTSAFDAGPAMPTPPADSTSFGAMPAVIVHDDLAHGDTSALRELDAADYDAPIENEIMCVRLSLMERRSASAGNSKRVGEQRRLFRMKTDLCPGPGLSLSWSLREGRCAPIRPDFGAYRRNQLPRLSAP